MDPDVTPSGVLDNEQYLNMMNVGASSSAAEWSSFEGESTPSPTVRAKRSGNFNIPEDKLLVSGWLNTSMDGAVGTDQTRGNFWERVHTYFHQFKDFVSDRGEVALKNRWSDIRKATNKFSSAVAEIERRNQSGVSIADKQGAALEFYKGTEKKAYPYLHCWLILKDAPKWTNRFTGNAVRTGMPPRSSQDSASPIDLDADLEAIERPEHGQKEAKRRAKKSKNCLGNEDDAFAAAFGELAQKKKEFDDRKLAVLQEAELKREERFERAFAQEQERIALEKRRDDERIAIEKRRDDERIMAIDLNSLAAPQKEFYMALQMEILARVCRG